MPAAIRLILLGIVLGLAAIDTVWQQVRHYYVDMEGLRFIAEASMIPLCAGLFYTYVRKDERLSAMLFGLCFLITFGTVCSLYTYYALSIAGPRIDDLLAAIDRGLGVDWPAWIAFVARHPWLDSAMSVAYRASIPQILLFTLWMGWSGPPRALAEFYLAFALSALATVLCWTAFPSFGAVTVYWIPDDISPKLGAMVGNEYGHELMRMLANGPAAIGPPSVKGLVGFPSFHAVESLLLVWYSRRNKWLFPPLLTLNIMAVAATPIIGGHHFVDVIGGGFVAFTSIWLARAIYNRVAERDARAVAPQRLAVNAS